MMARTCGRGSGGGRGGRPLTPPGRPNVHFALESAVPTVVLECKMHLSTTKGPRLPHVPRVGGDRRRAAASRLSDQISGPWGGSTPASLPTDRYGRLGRRRSPRDSAVPCPAVKRATADSPGGRHSAQRDHPARRSPMSLPHGPHHHMMGPCTPRSTCLLRPTNGSRRARRPAACPCRGSSATVCRPTSTRSPHRSHSTSTPSPACPPSKATSRSTRGRPPASSQTTTEQLTQAPAPHHPRPTTGIANAPAHSRAPHSVPHPVPRRGKYAQVNPARPRRSSAEDHHRRRSCRTVRSWPGSPAATMRSPSKPGARTPVRPARPMAAAREAAAAAPRREAGHGLHEHGVLGGSFQPALDRAAVRTAESQGNRRAHPMCRPERSSQGAKTEIRRDLRPLLTRHVNGSGRPLLR